MTFTESRPYKSQYYYVLVVTKGLVSYSVQLKFGGCGNSGLYGPSQRDWYMVERGLIKQQGNGSGPGESGDKPPQSKEPTTGFQLFARRGNQDLLKLQTQPDFKTFDGGDGGSVRGNGSLLQGSSQEVDSSLPHCIATFDFSKITDVQPFKAGYVLQV